MSKVKITRRRVKLHGGTSITVTTRTTKDSYSVRHQVRARNEDQAHILAGLLDWFEFYHGPGFRYGNVFYGGGRLQFETGLDV